MFYNISTLARGSFGLDSFIWTKKMMIVFQCLLILCFESLICTWSALTTYSVYLSGFEIQNWSQICVFLVSHGCLCRPGTSRAPVFISQWLLRRFGFIFESDISRNSMLRPEKCHVTARIPPPPPPPPISSSLLTWNFTSFFKTWDISVLRKKCVFCFMSVTTCKSFQWPQTL